MTWKCALFSCKFEGKGVCERCARTNPELIKARKRWERDVEIDEDVEREIFGDDVVDKRD